jgi:DNA-directed RNA polymerase II subunit RPB2
MDDLFGDEPATYSDEYQELDPMDVEITQEEAWAVIDKYFDEKGLVAQQIDSFDEFIKFTVQELVQDAGEIVLTPEDQYILGQEVEQVNRLNS